MSAGPATTERDPAPADEDDRAVLVSSRTAAPTLIDRNRTPTAAFACSLLALGLAPTLGMGALPFAPVAWFLGARDKRRCRDREIRQSTMGRLGWQIGRWTTWLGIAALVITLLSTRR